MAKAYGQTSIARPILIGCLIVTCAVAVDAANTAKQRLSALSDKEFRQVQSLAQHGDAASSAMLGVAYEEAVHVQRDMTQAVKWYRAAASQGNVEVQHHLGVLFEQGKDVTLDLA